MRLTKHWPAAPILLVAALSGCDRQEPPAQAQPPAMPPPSVSIAAVVALEVTRWDEFTGRIEAVETVEISPRVDGYIDKVSFKEGGEVRKGDVLYVIDPRPYRAELARAQAELTRARAGAELTAAQVARARQLLETRVISAEEYDERVAADAGARADIGAAEAAVEKARLNVEFTEVRSPIDGRAGRAMVTAGNLVATQPTPTVLTTVVSMDPVYVYIDGDEQTYLRHAAMARSGERPSSREAPNPVRVGLANETGFPHEGHMDFIDNRLDPATGTIQVRAVLENKDRYFTPGLYARVQVIGSGVFKALLVDDRAIMTDQDRKYVYVVGADNLAQRRDVKPGRLAEGLRIIEEGLAEGDRVIVHGVQKVFFPGMPVAPQLINMGDPPPAPSPPGPPADGMAGGEAAAKGP